MSDDALDLSAGALGLGKGLTISECCRASYQGVRALQNCTMYVFFQ